MTLGAARRRSVVGHCHGETLELRSPKPTSLGGARSRRPLPSQEFDRAVAVKSFRLSATERYRHRGVKRQKLVWPPETDCNLALF